LVSEPRRSEAATAARPTPCEVETVGGAMSPVAGCGAMPQDDDAVMIGVATTSSSTRGGRCVRQEGVVMGAATASTTIRWRRRGDRRCDGVVHDKEVFAGVMPREQVLAVRCR
jgi:hypothetical protein